MKIRKIATIIILLSLLSGCSSPSYDSEAINNGIAYENEIMSNDYVELAPIMSSSKGMGADSYVYTPNEVERDESRKLIRTVDIDMKIEEAESLQLVVQQIQLLAQQYGGYITYNSINMNDGNDYVYLNLQIPEDRANDMISSVQQLNCEVTGVQDSYDDVTLQYSDVETRLAVKEAARDRYLELLEKAESVEDILNIQRELNSVIEEIESTQTRKNKLDNKINYTEFSIDIDARSPISRSKFVTRMKETVSNLSYICGEVFLWCITAVICAFIGIVLCAFPIIFLIVQIFKISLKFNVTKIRFRKRSKEVAEDE